MMLHYMQKCSSPETWAGESKLKNTNSTNRYVRRHRESRAWPAKALSSYEYLNTM